MKPVSGLTNFELGEELCEDVLSNMELGMAHSSYSDEHFKQDERARDVFEEAVKRLKSKCN